MDGPPDIAHVMAQLAEDRRHRIGGERGAARRVERVDRLHKAEARDLEEIVEWLRRVAIAVGDAAGEGQVPLNQLPAQLRIARSAQLGEQFEDVVSARKRSVAHGCGPSPDRRGNAIAPTRSATCCAALEAITMRLLAPAVPPTAIGALGCARRPRSPLLPGLAARLAFFPLASTSISLRRGVVNDARRLRFVPSRVAAMRRRDRKECNGPA